ncbi:MAG: Crp/Fnr family transcriptional regulator [Acidimicrobiales bacterium]
MTAESLFLNAPVHRSASAEERIYSEGEDGTHMYGVVSGAVELRKGEVVVASLGPNDVFGERALIDHLPRSLTAVATADTVLAEIDRGLFLFLVHETPTFALAIMGALASRLRDYDELVARSSGDTPARD